MQPSHAVAGKLVSLFQLRRGFGSGRLVFSGFFDGLFILPADSHIRGEVALFLFPFPRQVFPFIFSLVQEENLVLLILREGFSRISDALVNRPQNRDSDGNHHKIHDRRKKILDPLRRRFVLFVPQHIGQIGLLHALRRLGLRCFDRKIAFQLFRLISCDRLRNRILSVERRWEHEQYQKEYCNFQDQFSRPLHRLHREIGDFLMVTDEPVHAVEVLAEEAQEYICKEKPEDQMPVERHFHQHTDHILNDKPEKVKRLWLVEERRYLPRFHIRQRH